MAEQWAERKFPFDTPVSRMPCLLERLRGAVARIEEKVRGVSIGALRRRGGKSWSAQENIGHLIDIEELHLARLDELAEGRPELRAADMTNQRTWDADHNNTPLSVLLERFRVERARLVERLETWNPDRLAVSAIHPRLHAPMRVVDLAFFVAEHDDHHLARIHELLAHEPRAQDAVTRP